MEVLVWKYMYHVSRFLMVLGNMWINLNDYQMLVTTQWRMILVELAASKQCQRGGRLKTITVTKSQGSEMCVTGGKKTLLKDYM